MTPFIFLHAQQHTVRISNEEKKRDLMELSTFNCLCLVHLHIVHMFHSSSLGQALVSHAESLSVCEGVCDRVNVP